MKKRMISLFLTVAMLLGMVVIPVAATPEETPMAPADSYEADVWFEASTGEELQSYMAKDKATNPLSVNDFSYSKAGTTVGIRLTDNVDTNGKKTTGIYATLYVGHYNEDDANDSYPLNIVLDLNGYTITDTSKINRLFGIYCNSTFVITNGTIIANGCYIGSGNVLFSSGQNNITLDGVRIVENSTATAANYGASSRENASGGIYRGAGNVTVKNSVLELNTGHLNYGGIMHINDTATVTLERTVFRSALSVEAGSCIYAHEDAVINANDCVFLGSTAAPMAAVSGATADSNPGDDGCGGTIYNDGTMTLNNCIVTGGTAVTQGGNIYNSGVLTLSSTDVESGNASTYSDNIYIASGATLKMSSGTVDGGVLCHGTARISGTAKIHENYMTGIHFENKGTARFTTLRDTAKIVVSGSATVSSSPDLATYMSKDLVIGAARTALTLSGSKLTATADDTDVSCAHCGKTVTWTAFTSDTTQGHCYLPEGGLTATPAAQPAGSELVLDLAGQTLDLTAAWEYNGNLSIVNTTGQEGKVFRSTEEDGTEAGGLLSGGEDSRFYLYGGTLTGIAVSGLGGGTIFSKGEVYLYGGTVTGGSATTYGGNIYIYDVDGAGTGTLTIYGGSVTNGSAGTYGGNIVVSGAEKTTGTRMTIAGGLIRGGTSAASAGNVYIEYLTNTDLDAKHTGDRDGYAKIRGGVIADGYAVKNGGNLYQGSQSDLTITAGAIISGQADALGGNYYCSATSARMVVENGWFSSGTAGTYGGNLYPNAGKMYFYDGTIAFGTATLGGGNLYLNNGYYYDSDTAKTGTKLKLRYSGNTTVIGAQEEGQLPVIMGGRAMKVTSTAYSGMGGNLMLVGGLTLGKASITGGYAASGNGKELCIAKVKPENAQRLTVQETFTQDLPIYIYVGKNNNADNITTVESGKAIHSLLTAEGALNAQITVENLKGQPPLCVGPEGQLIISAAGLVEPSTGEMTCYQNAAAAIAAMDGNDYLKLLGPAQITMTGDLVADTNGHDLTVTGTGTLYAFDNHNDDYLTESGKITAAGVTVAPDFRAPNGNRYVTLREGETITCHRIHIDIPQVALRPAVSGIYFKSTMSCDSTLQAKLKTYGIAVSTVNMPGADFRADGDTLYTEAEGSSFLSGQTQNSVLIRDILTGTGNDAYRGAMAVFAAPYAVVDNGTQQELVVMGRDDDTQNGISCSLRDVFQGIDSCWHSLNQSQKDSVRAVYTQYETALSTWNVANIALEVAAAEGDIAALEALYAGREAYHGNLHEHSDSGDPTVDPFKTADGRVPIADWPQMLDELDLDFAALVDHRQSWHMRRETWDETRFIGATETGHRRAGSDGEVDPMHYNILMTDVDKFEQIMASFPEFNYSGGYFSIEEHLSEEDISRLAQMIRDAGGIMVHVHPCYVEYMSSDNLLDYTFGEYTGLEVLYGYKNQNMNADFNQRAYNTWVGLLNMGQHIYAFAGADTHEVTNTVSASTVYAGQRLNSSYMEHIAAGDVTAGPVGIRMTVGDAVMGGHTDFTGKRLVVSVDDFQSQEYHADHQYQLRVYNENGLVLSEEFDAADAAYFAMDAQDCMYYRAEVYDLTEDYIVALGNPIWND